MLEVEQTGAARITSSQDNSIEMNVKAARKEETVGEREC